VEIRKQEIDTRDGNKEWGIHKRDGTQEDKNEKLNKKM
jgi:hypothetical protein